LVTAITGDKKNTLFIGTSLKGLSKVVIQPNQTFSISDVMVNGLNTSYNNEIISLLYDTKQNLWIGSALNSLMRIDAQNHSHIYETGGYVFSLYEDTDGTIWYGTWGSGFGKIDPATFNITRYSNSQSNYQNLSSDRIISILADNRDNLWLGTKGGGLNVCPKNLLHKGLSSFFAYTFDPQNPKSLSHNDVYCIFQDSKNNLWIGTGNGLNKLVLDAGNKTDQAILQGKATFERYTEANGLPNSVIYSITEDNQQNLWISTLNGIAKINPDGFIVTTYGYTDGLQDNEFHANACFKDLNGNLYFGGNQGLSFFNPDQISPNPYPAKICITGLTVMNQRVFPGQKVLDRVILNHHISKTSHITLGPKHKEFTIEFSGMHFSNINNVKYAYRLLGFNNQWRYTKNNEHSANYTNLFEGDYVFQVKATNNDGIWNDEIAELNITIKPVIWRNPWFFLCYLSLIVVLLFFFRKYSIIGVKEKNKLKIEALERQKAIELTESKMRFFTNISHEIRTPLTLIYSPLEKIIESDNLNTETRAALMLIRKNVHRLLSLTNQLLQLRRIDIGVVEPHYEKVNFIPYLTDILEYFEQQTKRKGITLSAKFEFNSSDDVVWIDKEMMTTTLYNLISNAYKYTQANGIIKIQAYHSVITNDKKRNKSKKNNKVPQRYLFIEITDNGTGIPSNDLPNVFRRFYQGQNQHATEQTGSGIGLSIVKEYIDLHKGYITVNSTPGKGTTFLIQIPLDTYHIAPHQFKATGLAGSKEGPYLPEPEFEVSENSTSDSNTVFDEDDTRPIVLIVEDDLDMMAFLASSLNKNYKVIKATNGKKAIKQIANFGPNIVITDVMMPEMDGHELCQYIKSNIETCHIPIIMLSAQAANDDIITGYEHGADRYISKPFDLEVLLAQVNQLLNTRKQLIDLYSKKILLKPREITITSMDEKFLTRIMDIIEDNIADSEFDITTMVDKMNMSHSSVLKKIKALTGVSLVEFVRRHRLNKAAMILQQEKLPITEVAYMTGFSDPKYFSKCFSKQFGKTPTEYIDEHEKNNGA
jgi:signal transduction histidine kinase/DNA-binding response OmpR family regulator